MLKKININESEETKKSAIQEFKMMKVYEHPNIVKSIESWINKRRGQVCIVMEEAEGGDLH